VETYDIVMLVVLLGAALFGAIKGFAWQLASIASIVVSYIVAYRLREPFSQSIHADPPWNRFLAMLILYIGTSLVIWVLFRMIRGSIDRLKLKEFDRQIGFLFGLAKGALYCTLITLFAVTLAGETVRGKVVASKSGRYIAEVLDKSESVIPPEIHEVVQPYLERFDEQFAGPGNGLGIGPPFGSGNGPASLFPDARETMLENLQPWANQIPQQIPQRAGELLPGSFQNNASNGFRPSVPPTNQQPWQPFNGGVQNAQQPRSSTPWNGFQR
jgi:membrane protein required for colicin V production